MSANSFILSIGTSVPAHKILQEQHHAILDSANGMSREEKLHLRKIYHRSGIESRHSVLAEFGSADHPDNILFHPADLGNALPVSERMKLFENHASGLCEKAIATCLKDIPSLSADRITHLITFSCTGMYAPGLDMQLVEKLGLNRNVERTCINFMGCYAGINALKVADYIVRAQEGAVVLVAGVELCTLHYQKNMKPDQLIANSLFADGAAACIVSSEKRLPENEKPRLKIRNFYSEFIPAGKEEMVWRIGDFGFDLRLSASVPALIKEHIFSLAEKIFKKASMKQSDVDLYALHPGGMKILDVCKEALNLTREQIQVSYDILRDYGNMSSVTIFFVLKKQLNSISTGDSGKKMLACAFGPGLTMESMIAEIG